MAVQAPHFLLKAECHAENRAGDWRFALQTADGRPQSKWKIPNRPSSGERLELLAVVRGLEALDQPSRVTLLTASSYVSRGIEYGLDDWRANNWQWERHGKMVPVKNGDLWRRLDLRFYQVHCFDCRSATYRTRPRNCRANSTEFAACQTTRFGPASSPPSPRRQRFHPLRSIGSVLPLTRSFRQISDFPNPSPRSTLDEPCIKRQNYPRTDAIWRTWLCALRLL